MTNRTDAFSTTFKEAREKFLRACGDVPVHAYAEPLRGVDMEKLAVDVVRIGDAGAGAVLLISSGCHGVEGYCGSGAQVDLIEDRQLLEQARDADVALVFVHALNPWGFSFGRRVTHEGVDLNRNFVDFSQPLPRNLGYDRIAAPLLPDHWPPSDANEQALSRFVEAHGMAEFQRAVSGGQYHHPAGLFHGGTGATWSHLTLRHVLRHYGGACRQLGWIDLHSGLGETGVGEKIFAGRNDPAAKARARSWWGDAVTFLDDGSSTSSALEGSLWCAAYDECPLAAVTPIALEFGTRPMLEVLGALRLDHWVACRPGLAESFRTAARALMRDAFFVDTPSWKLAVLDQARDAVSRAISGLSTSP